MITNKTINIFLIDDEFPKIPEFTASSIYDSAINSENLYHLAITQTWKGLQPLQQLIKDIVTSQASKDNHITLSGYTKPTQCLNDIDSGSKPDVLIYDWEYGMPNPTESQGWLLEILSNTDAFVFIYSKVRDELPPFLNKKVFDEYAHRFQLFLKGSSTHSIFSSEEFMLQYILGKVSDSGRIKIQGFDVEFTSNDYLKRTSDILYLERVLGKMYLLEEFKKYQFTLNNETIKNLLNDSKGYLYFSEARGLLISPDENALVKKLKPLQELSYSSVAKQYSIYKLEEALEKGTAII